MRSKFFALIASLCVSAAAFGGTLLPSLPAGAAALNRTVGTYTGVITSIVPTGAGAFEMGLFNYYGGQGSFVPVDPAGAEGAPTPVGQLCGALPLLRGLTSFGENGTDHAAVYSDGLVAVTLNGSLHGLTTFSTDFIPEGVVVSEPTASGIRTMYIALYNATDGSGAVQVVKFDATGTIVTGGGRFNQPGVNGLSAPTLSSDGIIVAGLISGALYRFNPDATPSFTTLLPEGSLSNPGAIAIDDHANIYIAENGTDELSMLTPEGALTHVLTFGTAMPPGSQRRIPVWGNIATALAFDTATRSLLLARSDHPGPVAPRYCNATNVISTLLRIGTAPTAPGLPSVTTTSDSATVSWSPSSDEIPGDVYTVTASPGGASCTAVAPLHTCTITGLTAMTTYNMSVLAQSPEGLGAATVTLSAVTGLAATGLAATGDSIGFLGLSGLLLSGAGLFIFGVRRRMRPIR